jgi:hypothetical protein
MEHIIHRVNLIDELKTIPKEYGCEIDIRTDGSKLILNHDPFKKGDSLIDYLDEYKNGTLVLNIKESGIEEIVLEEVRKRNINSYFLLDVEFPYLFSASERGEKNISVRFSEKEPIENVSLLIDKVDWVWVDTITKSPINEDNVKILKKFNICLVCPSRWHRSYDIKPFIADLKKYQIYNNCSIMTSLKSINEFYKL